MIVIVTGSRDYADRELVRARLDDAVAGGRIHLKVGDCPTGADAFARGWATRNSARCELTVFEARWRRPDGTRDRTGGPARNARMVDSGADLCLAFFAPPPALNRGTAGCAGLAWSALIEVWEFGRRRPWSEVMPGDVVRGADGLAWAVEDAGRGSGVTLSHAGRIVTGRPDMDAAVEVVSRGGLGRAIDNLAAVGLSGEVIDTGRRNR